MDLAGGIAGGVGHLQRLVAAIGDAHHVAFDLVDHGALLLDGAGDDGIGIDHSIHLLGDGAESLFCLLRQPDPLLRFMAGRRHGGDRGAGAGLQLFNHLLDLDGGPLGAVGKRPHLVGHHRKAATLLTGTGRFDGGVEGQQVGLLGNAADHADDAANLAALLLQLAYGVGGAQHLAVDMIDGLDGALHHILALTDHVLRLLRHAGGLQSVACHVL